MKGLIKQYFTFNKQEGRVIGFLAFFIALVLLFQYLFLNIFTGGSSIQLTKKDSVEINHFLSRLEKKKNEPYLNRLDKYIVDMYDTLKLFDFDPNTVPFYKLRKLGLTEKQANNVLNYRKKGGKFYVPDDFRKIYSIRTKQYQILESFIKIKSSEKDKAARQNRKKKAQRFAFDPNFVSKDSLLLLGFKGKLADRLIKFRKYKPFQKKEDLLKIYGIDSSLFANLADSIKIDLSKFPAKRFKSNLNKIYSSELIKKYGFDELSALRFVKYRQILGGFYSTNQIYEVRGIDSLKVSKLIAENYLDTGKIRKFNINTRKFHYHPYFKRNAKDKLRRYRLSHDDFKTLEEIRLSKIFTSDEWSKIKYYLGVDSTCH